MMHNDIACDMSSTSLTSGTAINQPVYPTVGLQKSGTPSHPAALIDKQPNEWQSTGS